MHRSLRLQALEDRLTPAIATWDGGGVNNLWTTPANWVGDVAPLPGDDLVFPPVVAQFTSVNDFPAGTAFHSLGGPSNFTAPGYQISGNAIALAAGLHFDLNYSLQVTMPLTLTSDQSFEAPGSFLSGPIELNGHALTFIHSYRTSISAPISGVGSLTISDNSLVTLTTVNTYSGPTIVTLDGSLVVDGAIPGPVTVQSAISPLGGSSVSGTGSVGAVTLNNGGSIGPGDATAGTLTTGDLNLIGAATAGFSAGPTAGSKIDVHGSVHLAGTVSVLPEIGTVRLGDHFIIISNDGTDPIVGAFANCPEGGVVSSLGGGFRITYHGGDGNDVEAFAIPHPEYAVAAGAGGLPQVNVYDAFGDLLRTFNAYDPNFRGGVRVLTVDLNYDDRPEIITAPGPGGGPDIRIWDSYTGALLREFNAYDPNFRGGVFLAAADLNVDRNTEIITGAGAGGGPHVKAFDGVTGAQLESFMAYDVNFRGGVSVAGINGYFQLHFGLIPGLIITGAGPGGGPHVKVFTSTGPSDVGGTLRSSFFAYSMEFRGGVNVSARFRGFPPTDLASSEVITAPASSGGPDVRIYNLLGQQLGGFLAYDPSFFGGVTLGLTSLVNGPVVVLTGAGPGGGPHVKIWALNNNAVTLQNSFLAFDPAFTGGIYVG